MPSKHLAVDISEASNYSNFSNRVWFSDMTYTQIKVINLREIRQTITEFIEIGALDRRVIDILICQDIFVPKECELWDYKRTIGRDAVSLAETILQVVSFYNTYGGYLVYGVGEVIKDKEFVPVGIAKGSLDLQQLKQRLANYTGDEIDISYAEVECTVREDCFVFGLLHIPKRPYSKAPTFFGKNGPQTEKGELVFQKDKACIRSQDKCIVVETKDDYQLLFGERINPFLWDTSFPAQTMTGTRIVVDHNLPDRNFICPKFFGRDREIQELWTWLADELANTKILAGDGGKGKTSIAYEFAEEVCRTKPYGIEKVIWLTAKSKQFVGILDQFVNVPQTNYFDLESLLKSLCSELAILEEEMEDASISMLKRLIKNAVANIACMIVVDDVDSTELEQQRMIFETAMQFPGSRAHFLLTTRMNIMFSSAGCITVGGLEKNDYDKYVANVLERFECASPTTKQVERMRKVTDGSPLFTDSLLRLYRMGMPIEDAIRQWEGKLGSEARKAALKREVETLSIEARRVLLACSYMGEASLTELKQVTGYDEERMQMCIGELTALFLVSAQPIIKKEVRFRVSNNTARLVLDNATMLVTDPSALMDNVGKLRKGRMPPLSKRGYLHPVGAAITQAVALLRDSRYDDAIETVESTLNSYKDNPDLLFTRGRCLLDKFKSKGDSISLSMARRAFKKSYDCGQHKELMFDLWYESEMLANDPSGAIEVAKVALKNEIPITVEWLKKRASAYIESSKAFERTMNFDLAIEHMKNSVKDISEATTQSKYYQKSPLREILYQINDRLWTLTAKIMSRGLAGSKELFDGARFSIKLGDYRPTSFERLLYAVGEACGMLSKADKVSRGQLNLLQQMLREAKLLLGKASNTIEWQYLNILRERLYELEDEVHKLSGNTASNES